MYSVAGKIMLPKSGGSVLTDVLRNRKPKLNMFLHMGSSGNTVSPLGGLSRGYASEVCFGVCFGGMLRGMLRMFHHMELTSYLRGFQKSFQPFVYLCVYPCRDVKYLTHAFKIVPGSGS